MIVFPSAFNPPKRTLLLHCAEPLFSKNLIGFNFFGPLIIRGKLRFLCKLKEAPNLLKGSAILLKSLLDKLLSPTILIGKGLSIKIPEINRPSVPEF